MFRGGKRSEERRERRERRERARRTTDRDLQRVSARSKVNAQMRARQATDRDLQSQHHQKKWMLGYHSAENDYSFDALQAYCFRINL